MNQFSKPVFWLFTICLLLSGCKKEPNILSSPDLQIQLRIEAQSTNLFPFPDSVKQTEITAILTDHNGFSVPDYEIKFHTDPMTLGRLDSYSGMTDTTGQVKSIFSSIANWYGAFDVIATLENEELQAKVTINIRTIVSSLELRVSNNQIIGSYGEDREEKVWIVATNAAGVGIPNIEILLAIQNPAAYKGCISFPPGNGLTDMDGILEATYRVVIERDVDVEIIARHGEIEGRKTIEVRVE